MTADRCAGQLWSEYTPTAAQVEYMAFPRMCALAERAWGSPAQSWEEFEERLRGHLPDSTPSASATARWTDMALLPPRRPPYGRSADDVRRRDQRARRTRRLRATQLAFLLGGRDRPRGGRRVRRGESSVHRSRNPA
ncbi:family 20 glycosylhydrolase [Brachybacterium sacelli]|uniref:family 20 glycosylhydrolase n=1 Tax=Brachybacterium sacelli TaxID=173364 RepID=UPI003618AB87